MKNNPFRETLLVFALVILILLPLRSASAAERSNRSAFSGFIVSVANGQAKEVRGVYVPGTLALRVMQQPADDPESVSRVDGVATQFRPAAQNRVIGLLAHNNLAGATFSDLKIGQEVRIVYGDRRVEYYQVNWLASFQALHPGSQNEKYVDLRSHATYNAQEIFTMFYNGAAHVTFQTCILQDGNSSWGRLFVTAIPVSSIHLREFQTLTLQTKHEISKVVDSLGPVVGYLGFR